MAERAVHPRSIAFDARHWLRRLGYGVAALLVLWGLMWLGLPPLLKWQLQKQGSAALGRQVSIERIDVRPWSLVFDLQGLQVANAAGTSTQFSVRRVYIDMELQSLLRWAPVVDALRIEAPELHVQHTDDGRLDLDDVIQRLQAPADEPGEPGGPVRFAIFNIDVTDGALTLEDRSVGVTHRLHQLNLSVPFLSNLGSRREVVTEPRLAFELNGSRFDTRAATTPFAQDRETRVRLQIPDLDVQPYLAYWPASLPARLRSAHLHLDLSLAFEQHDQPTLVLSGQAAVSDVAFSEGDEVWLRWQRLAVDLDRVEVLRQRASVARVRLTGPALTVTRDARGGINLQRMLASLPVSQPVSQPASQPASGSSSSTAGWQLAVNEVTLEEGAVHWRDAAVRPQADVSLSAMQFKATGLTWPVQQAVPLSLDARLGDTPLQLSGRATDQEASAQLTLGELPLSVAAPYVAQYLTLPLAGRAQAALEFHWRAAAEPAPPGLRIDIKNLSLDDVLLGSARQPQVAWSSLTVADGALDLMARRIEVGRMALRGPRVALERRADGRWQAQDWLRSTSPASAADEPAAPSPAPAWDVRLNEVALDGGRVAFVDEQPGQRVALNIDGLSLRAANVQPLAAKPPPTTLKLQARLTQAPAGDGPREVGTPAQLRFDGRVQLPGATTGAGARGQLVLERVPLHAFVPYVADQLNNLEVLRAEAGLQGELDLSLSDAGPRVDLRANASIDDLRANSIAPAEELLTWASLQLRGLAVRVVPGEATVIGVDETALSDYFARVLIDEQGRINLQGLLKSSAPQQPQAPTPQAQAPEQSAAPAQIRIGPISLVNGRVRFSDRFIKPNYTANLSEVTGRLSAFSSEPPAPGQPLALADLSLKGRAEGTALLDVAGQINPLATPLAMDIKGQVRDLELPPLSPYSAKYAGYGIERGKLSVDVRYRIEPSGQLEASNQIVLNQLSFGERDPASSANLPVKLAVALLADRDGVIDINLPISGSLNDPQFRLGPIIVRLIVNLIGKAITAPFSLIANALSAGGADASRIAFEPGRATLDDADRRQLDAVAKALLNRPALRLTIVGEANAEAERAGWQAARLDELLRTEKRRQLARAGGEVPARPVIEAAEREALLREAYRRADIPKPRNFIGIAKDIPVPEMEALLLAAQVPDEQAMRELAVARAVAVKEHLLRQQLAEDRVFLGAPRLGSAGQGEATKAQVELQLAAR
ncbi:MAG: DUF748 domain-containing protein [Hydrogenophaga sp.]|uniref:DUF748 domain-containing protein n=1 Tax=Hydrogenophaga sp. TaxID=1904254 RepID=UPI001DF4D9A0|nr:DUF748 domain-containing protein [Hydrogenophaga sp.]MBX3610609.1 DUF748 domain-containing protein [Hydrogenophaga sp.]